MAPLAAAPGRPGGRHPLTALLEPRSVAVVGASARPGSFGDTLVAQLLGGGFEGTVHLVNPRYREVAGLPCLPSLDDLPGPVDLAVLAVPNAALEAQLRTAAAHGIPAAVIFASCVEVEEGASGEPPLAERLRRIAAGAGMAVCGGNGMGFFNLEHSLRVCGYPEPADLAAGPVAVVSHSGSVFSALLHNHRDLRFNLVVSAGNELVTTTAAYLDHALELPSTRVAALFLETVREPAAFRAALAKAADRGIPVVALKVGRGQAARAMVAAHSGALAGDDGAYQALFDAFGVAQVATLDELADTCELLAGRRAHPGGLAAIHDSGGERAHLLDLAEQLRVPFAGISEATRERLAAVLEPGLPATNPLDAWGTGNDADQIFATCIQALLDDPATAALALNLDLTTEPTPETSYTGLAIDAAATTAKPVAVVATLASAADPTQAATLRAAGVPVLEGTASGLTALRHLLAYRDFLARRLSGAVDNPGHPTAGSATLPHRGSEPGAGSREAARVGFDRERARWWRRLGEPDRPLDEPEGLAMLGDWGVPVVAAEAAATLEEALAAAGRVGWPVALKTAAPGVAHKSDVGGVVLGVDGPDGLAAAYADLAARLGPRVLVAAMADPGVELALGVVVDPQFGPLVMVAAGGVQVEILRDRRFALPPVDRRQVMAMLDRLAIRPLLDGVRGAPPADLDAVADAVANLSVLALDLGDRLAAVDVNPLVAGPAGCVAVDALVVARAGEAGDPRSAAGDRPA
ncbi:MAG TPA: acetate--CoA ligase family protein [Actinomycetota bacterium]|nr:acetate--CoA ligase family protein [Actinomycetota bacterium]